MLLLAPVFPSRGRDRCHCQLFEQLLINSLVMVVPLYAGTCNSLAAQIYTLGFQCSIQAVVAGAVVKLLELISDPLFSAEMRIYPSALNTVLSNVATPTINCRPTHSIVPSVADCVN